MEEMMSIESSEYDREARPRRCPNKPCNYWEIYLNSRYFDILRETKEGKGGEIQITDALMEQAKNDRVVAFRFKGDRFDCGSIDGFVEATNSSIENYRLFSKY